MSSIRVSEGNILFCETRSEEGSSFRWNSLGIVVLGNGTAGSESNQLKNPFGIYIDNDDILYVADFGNNRIQRMILSTGAITTIAGNDTAGNRTGTPGNATNQFYGIKNLWLDSSYQYLYVVESLNNHVMRFSTNSINGTAGTIVAGGNNPGNNTDQLNNLQGIYYDISSNSMYIANYGGHTIIKWIPGASNGSFIVGTSGQNSKNFRIQRFCAKNGYQGTTIAGGNGADNSSIYLAQPRSLHFDSQMNLYVSNTTNHRIIKFVKL
ncbi:unnamed protein product [Rotaria sordida]|uniref:NHL repeat containing protein n=1 Tax=Rotaria sordida TaxID=392033 RepID=A0A813W4F2_9BILA|nr:unnamed protein product [Rotaria sordida]CAF0849818.1 unnamed protein product [Rotaria sordida]CAF3760872.1 unnamed protein product [Rotaria sordida]CAF3804861.1 unnamed protein product [Rotaria sordida]